MNGIGSKLRLPQGRQEQPEQPKDFLRALSKGIHKAALDETSGMIGGYLAPLDYSTALLSSLEENSLFRSRALVVPMKSLETTCPTVNATTAQAAGTSPFFGGFAITWTDASPSAGAPESEPTFHAPSLVARSLLAQMTVSNQFLKDIGAEGEMALMNLAGRAVAWSEDYAFFRGDGNGQPLGIVLAGASKVRDRTTSNLIGSADVRNMCGDLIPVSWNHAIWACSPTAFAQVSGITGFVPNANPLGAEQGCAGFLMSRPVFVTEKLPALGTKGDLVFFDPSLYVIGNRQETIVDVSEHPNFRTNQSIIRIWRRVDGKPWLDGTVTLADASSTASAYVVLN